MSELDLEDTGEETRLRRNSMSDAALIFGCCVALLALFIYVEAFEYVVHFSDTHESWEIDELLTVMMVLPIGMVVFSRRRLHEAKRELKLRIEAERSAQAMAMHDPLTGLANRRNITHAIGEALVTAAERPFALLVIDLDRFKSVNDLQGHNVGDAVLAEVASRLTAAVKSEGTVSRLGGDEFVILLPGAPSGDALISRVDDIAHCFSSPLVLAEARLAIGASIGVTYIDTPDLSTDQAIAQADAAMYSCKVKQRLDYCFFETGMEMAAIRRAQIESELRDAIAGGQVEPFYQPLVNLETGRTVGYEVLARWRLPDGELRMPAEFIQIAEETGQIGELYYSLLRQVGHYARKCPADIGFAINLSPYQFDDDELVERTLEILHEANIAPSRLEVEITENALVTDVLKARHVIEGLKKHGIRIALDDFGTGYSSLRHLSEIDFDRLKIDGSFAQSVQDNEASRTIVRTVTAMAHNLGLQVTVEGIETFESAQSLIAYGCDIGQGFFYGKPQATIAAESVEDAA